MTQAVLADQPQPHPRMTFEEFLDYGDWRKRYEWVDGEVFEMPSPSVLHQLLEVFLCAILRAYVRAKGLGAIIPELTMRLPLRLPLRPSGRDPDIVFVSNANSHRIRTNYLDGAADLVIELISPSTEDQDREDKFLEYQQAGVQEYWLIDGTRQTAEFYQLDGNGYFQPILPDVNGIYSSSVITGLWIDTDWLWQASPSEFEIYRAWGLI